jgi:hypothetical protein
MSYSILSRKRSINRWLCLPKQTSAERFLAMNGNAAFPRPANPPLHLAAIALLTSALLLVGLCGSAAAKRHPLVSKDNKIHACYRVKGKPKGALRVVRNRRARCRRGERKVAWMAAAVPGAAGSTGQQGGTGQTGSTGSDGSNEALLKAQVNSLAQRVETLEGILQGVTNNDLLGAITGVSTLTTACTTVVEQSNDLAAGLEGTIGLLTGVPLIGDIFDGIEVPQALDPLDTCTDSEL